MYAQHDVICPTLVGRGPEMTAASQVLARAKEGHGRVALIVGEAGVGKSRLLRAMMDEARAAGFLVLRGASFEAEAAIPYAPLLDLVRLLAGSTSPAVVTHILGPAAPELVAMFPELRGVFLDVTPSAAIDPESDKRRLFRSLVEALSAVARTQPILIAFEDVHWTDDATLDLIFHLARSHASQPVVMALTYRGDEAGPRLARLVTDLERARLATELPVDALGREQVAEMLHAIFGPRETLGDEFMQRLYELTEGNPFFVEETLKALIIAGDLAATSGTWRARPLERIRVPRTAVEAVRRRLAALTVPARVGKRMIETGKTRVRRFVTERDVSADVTLHEEHAEVLRRAVTDPKFLANVDWSDKEIEVIETAEQALVSKTAKVVEEIALKKIGSDHVQTLHEKVRRQEAAIEHLGPDGKKIIEKVNAPELVAGSFK